MAQAPLAPGEDSVMLTIRVVGSVAEGIDQLAVLRSSTRSAMVRDALEAYLEQHQEVLAS